MKPFDWLTGRPEDTVRKNESVHLMLKPYAFIPYLKETIWGGTRLGPFKGVATSAANIGESWEISAVPGYESVVAEGSDKGRTLPDLIREYGPRLVGQNVFETFGTAFPLLIKFIDAAQDLSIQVHPDDELAKARHNCRGKTEMWYVIDAAKDAKVYSGLHRKLTPAEFEDLTNGQHTGNPFADVLVCHPSHSGDVFFLPAGRLHAIGAGNLLAEIQETSDITYRVYDFDRVGADGKKRELHTALAKDAIDYRVLPDADYRTTYDTSAAKVPLISCPYFKVQRLQIKGAEMIDLHTESFVVVMCLEGEGEINGVKICRGQTLLIPAEANILSCTGTAALLTATI
jgi:mannose-6-phosphate isomerase